MADHHDVSSARWPRAGWLLLFAGSELLYLALAWLSGRFRYGEGHEERPILEAVAILGLATLLYWAACRRAWKGPAPSWPWTIASSLLFRLTLLPTQPIQEDDFYRYLWDGKVAASGLDPYRFSPAEIVKFEKFPAQAGETANLGALSQLSRSSPANRLIFERVNYSEFVTIYPAGAQVFFALADWTAPDRWPIEWQVMAWKGWVVAFDLGTLVLLAILLRAVHLPSGYALAYGWCPLVLKEFANSGHMDAMAGFFLLLALVGAARGRWALAGWGLGAGAAVKFFAAAALPFALILLYRKKTAGWKVLAAAALSAALAGAALLAWPESRDRRWEALWSFFTGWENHDAVFLWVKGTVRIFSGLGESWADEFARAVVLAIWAVLLAWQCLYCLRDKEPAKAGPAAAQGRLLGGLFAALAALFILSPIGFPWYFTWCIPLLPFARRRAWFLLPGFLLAYYLRFWFLYQVPGAFLGYARGVEFYDAWIVSIEFGAFFLLWFLEGVAAEEE